MPFYRLEGESLREIDIRCLLITGNADESVNLESVVRSTEYIQKYYLKVVDGAGHYPHQESPEKVNKALLDFLLGKSVSIGIASIREILLVSIIYHTPNLNSVIISIIADIF